MIHHMCINISCILRQKKSLGKLFYDEDGTVLNNIEARKMLNKMLAEGKRLFPVGDCEGFNYETGCPGHPSEKYKNAL